jgi:molybdopterin converting factor small subunit
MLTIEYTAQLRRAAGVASETFACGEECPLEDVVRWAIERHGDALRRVLVDAQGRLQRSILVFVDEEQLAGGAGTKLRSGQTVTFAAPISGG